MTIYNPYYYSDKGLKGGVETIDNKKHRQTEIATYIYILMIPCVALYLYIYMFMNKML